MKREPYVCKNVFDLLLFGHPTVAWLEDVPNLVDDHSGEPYLLLPADFDRLTGFFFEGKGPLSGRRIRYYKSEEEAVRAVEIVRKGVGEVHVVQYVGSEDEPVLKVFTDREKAKAYAGTVAKHYDEDAQWDGDWQWGTDGSSDVDWSEHHPDVEAALRRASIDVGTFHGIRVVTSPLS
jgi:hypothetical protein